MAYIHLAKEKKYYKGKKVMPKHGNTHTRAHKHTHTGTRTLTHAHTRTQPHTRCYKENGK